MTKLILILMLTVTQVLAGTCGPRYLCFKADGSFCCFDEGPKNCDCCALREEVVVPKVVVQEPACGCCHGEPEVAAVENAGGLAETTSVVAVITSDDCGCSHVQVTDGAPSVSVSRSGFASDFRAAQDVAVVHNDLVAIVSELHANTRTTHRSPQSSSARILMDLAWVSIRC